LGIGDWGLGIGLLAGRGAGAATGAVLQGILT